MTTRNIVLTEAQDKELKKLSYEKDLSVSALIRVALRITYDLPSISDMPDDEENKEFFLLENKI